jgi:hypothetical protein
MDKNGVSSVFSCRTERNLLRQYGMGRLPRPVEDGLVYHALNRGNNRAPVFADDDDFRAFLESLAQTQSRYPFRLLEKMVSDQFFLARPNETCHRITAWKK